MTLNNNSEEQLASKEDLRKATVVLKTLAKYHAAAASSDYIKKLVKIWEAQWAVRRQIVDLQQDLDDKLYRFVADSTWKENNTMD